MNLINEDLFQNHISIMLSSGGDQLGFLELNGLNEINDQFLIDQLLPILVVHNNLKVLSLKHLNNLKLSFLNHLLMCTNNNTNNDNLPFCVDLKNCKNVSKKYIYKFNKLIKNIY